MNSHRFSRFNAIVRATLTQTRWRLLLGISSLLAVTFTELLAPWPIKLIFDYILLQHPVPASWIWLNSLLQYGTIVALSVLCASIAVIAAGQSVFAYLQSYTMSRLGHELVHSLRSHLFSHLQRLPLAFHNKHRSGEILTKVSNDTTALRDAFTDIALNFASHLITLFGMLAIMFVLNWQLSVVVALTLPLLLTVVHFVNRRIKANVRVQRSQEGRIASRINQALYSMPLIQAFGREAFEADRFRAESAENLEAGVRASRTTAVVGRVTALVAGLGTAATVLMGSWLVLRQRMSPGDLLVFVSYVRNLYRPVRDLSRLSARISRAAVSADRICEILNTDPPVQDMPNAIEAPPLRGEIVLDGVCFSYDTGPKVLDGVSFRVAPGQKVALVGSSGTGKSTILGLLLRLYEPQAGAICVDGIDVRRYKRDSLCREIGTVLQDSLLFGESVRDNIAYGKPDATAVEIEYAARKAHAHAFIEELPQGYDTVLGERGCTLSGGQRQRICLARALIKNPSILLLDEPTSAIDAASAALVHDAIAELHKLKTCLVITHARDNLTDYDQILVLHGGRIVEAGRHHELLALRGHYHRLVLPKDAAAGGEAGLYGIQGGRP